MQDSFPWCKRTRLFFLVDKSVRKHSYEVWSDCCSSIRVHPRMMYYPRFWVHPMFSETACGILSAGRHGGVFPWSTSKQFGNIPFRGRPTFWGRSYLELVYCRTFPLSILVLWSTYVCIIWTHVFVGIDESTCKYCGLFSRSSIPAFLRTVNNRRFFFNTLLGNSVREWLQHAMEAFSVIDSEAPGGS